MERSTHERLIERLRGGVAAPMEGGRGFRVDAERYRSAAWFERERAVFGALRGSAWVGPPRVIAGAAQVAPGACVPVDVPGASLLLMRGADGALRGFANACRHRATRLVDAPCAPKALVCPYHGWSYDLRGALIHVPHAETFAADDRRDLRALPVVERHGLVWLGDDVAGYLGALDRDIAALALDRCVVWRARRSQPRCNWKLIVEAFLEGYHIRVLHRDSIYRFFVDVGSVGESVGPHIRSVTARRALREAPAELSGVADLRALATPSFSLFPATVIIIHPDFVSVMSLYPLAADAADYQHLMFVPADRAGEAEHWDKSWALIEEKVFQCEDLWVCEQIQRGIADGTTDELVFGELEAQIRGFHATLDARSESAGTGPTGAAL